MILKRMPLTAAGAENAPGSVFCQVEISGASELSVEKFVGYPADVIEFPVKQKIFSDSLC